MDVGLLNVARLVSMFNENYSMPLHGVGIRSVNKNNSKLPLQVSLHDGDITLRPGAEAVWTHVEQGERYLSKLLLYRHHDGFVLKVNCEGKGSFFVQKNDITVDWQAKGTDSTHYFQTVGLALWLELHHIPCIHGNAIRYKDKAFALVAASGAGKSTLSVELCKEFGVWMTDDMIALHHGRANSNEIMVHTSWPVARLWPDTIETTLDVNPSEFKKVHTRFNKRQIDLVRQSRFAPGCKALSTIYMLNRIPPSDDYVESYCKISPLGASQALILLLQHSILGDAYVPLGLENKRVKQLSQLLEHIEVKEVTYTSGKGNLERVSNIILDDAGKR